jgi:hypothetical protein
MTEGSYKLWRVGQHAFVTEKEIREIVAHKQATAAATQLRLVAPGVLRILTLAGVDQLVPIYPTVEAALT